MTTRNSGSGTGEKGFTLIEMVIVVAILAVVAGIATIGISDTLKRQRLDAAANQLQSFIQSASYYARQNSIGVFVWLAHRPAPGGGGTLWWYCYLIQDTNGNDVLDYNLTSPSSSPPGNGADTWINAERSGMESGVALPNDIMIAAQNGAPNANPPVLPKQWPGPSNWPVSATDFILLCDPRILPFDPTLAAPAQITRPLAISLTHSDMVTKTLQPKFRYDITVSPLWQTKLDKVGY